MKSSFKAFMQEIIDYAGLFPPANLSLDTSIQKYSRYRKGDDAWMLSRYIIPARRLEELERYNEPLFQEGEPFAFSVLGKGTETVSDYRDHLGDIVEALEQFYTTHGPRVTTDVLEIKLPREVVFASDKELFVDIFKETIQHFSANPALPNDIFFEGIFDKNWKKEVGLILESLSHFNNDYLSSSDLQTAFKLRCGGEEQSMIPSIEQLAFSLNEAREKNLAVKCTAGLHHPIRHYNYETRTRMHGFFNVFGGAMLSYAHDFSNDQLEEVLKEEDPEYFKFTDTGFRWKDFEIPTEEIEELRNVALISFGSCSFDEPREDLQKMGLLN